MDHGIKDLSVIDLDFELGSKIELSEDGVNDLEDLSIWEHGVVGPCNIEIALVEFSVSSLGHVWLISSVDLGDLVPLDILDIFQGHIPGEWHSQIVSEREEFSTLIFEIVDQLRIFSVLSGQGFFQLKDWSIDFNGSMSLENLGDFIEGNLSDGHLIGFKISCSLSDLGSSSLLILELNELFKVLKKFLILGDEKGLSEFFNDNIEILFLGGEDVIVLLEKISTSLSELELLLDSWLFLLFSSLSLFLLDEFGLSCNHFLGFLLHQIKGDECLESDSLSENLSD